MGTSPTVILAGTGIVPKIGIVLLVVNLMVVVLHTISEKSDSEVKLKQTGVAQGSTMQIVNGMVIISAITAVKEMQVQSLLVVQLLSEVQPARERRESHMCCLETHEVSKVNIRHEVYISTCNYI